ncbi:hypothetical protein SLS60_007217 [Paraconiothyrium brasiliense]|uniref:Uncharacterized protein n=1 Tax=Paraconiothyrium brasiliense TaxID=300254 RepID=A0ABR3R8S4_9PLEO
MPTTPPSFILDVDFDFDHDFKIDFNMDVDIDALVRDLYPEPPAVQPRSFAQDWSRLPQELRLVILTYVFLRDHAIDHAEYNKVLDTFYHPLLLTDSASVATEALFTHNRFTVSLSSKQYPSPAHNMWIRRIEIDTTVEEIVPGWSFLEKLCTGAFGFDKLSEIDIKLTSTITPAELRASRTISIIDHGLSPADLTLIVPKVRKLTLTRKIIFKKHIRCLLMPIPQFLSVPSGHAEPLSFWDRIHLRETTLEDFHAPAGIIDQDGRVHTYGQLPWPEVDDAAVGPYKLGTLAGLQVTRIQTLQHTISPPYPPSEQEQEQAHRYFARTLTLQQPH